MAGVNRIEPIDETSASIEDKALSAHPIGNGFCGGRGWGVMYPLNYWHPACVEGR
jgi:hypothetical protein